MRTRPGTPQALAAVKGFGASRMEKYGGATLEAIAAHDLSPAEEAEPETVPAPRAPESSTYVPTEEWTWRLLDRGFTPDEAAAIRGLDRAAVVRHATLAARQGKPVNVSLFLDAETLRKWES